MAFLDLTPAAGFDPLRLDSRSLPAKTLFVVGGSLVLALSSQLAVPMVPVPITMQSFAVTLIGALYGWRLGLAAVSLWLFEAMLGLPVLANGSGGLAKFVGPTAGYLAAFPLMAMMTGWLAARGISGRRWAASFAGHLGANLFCLAAGAVWLAGFTGWEKAMAAGVTPFLLGAVLKSALASALLYAMATRRKA